MSFFSVRHSILVRGLLLLAERVVHRDMVAGMSPRGQLLVQKNLTQNAVLLLLDMGLGSVGDPHSRNDDHGAQSHDTHDLCQAYFQRELLVQV